MKAILVLPLVFALMCGTALAQKAAPSPGALLPGGNGKQPVSVNANQLEYFSKEQKALYTGDVVAKQGDATLRSSNLTIFFGPAAGAPVAAADAKAPAPGVPNASGNSVRRMEAEGPVTITQKDQVGTGDRGWYEKAENKVYLIGNVTLSQGPNVAKGEKLVYDLTTGQAQIVGRVTSLFTPGQGGDDPTKPKGDKSDKGDKSAKGDKTEKPVRAEKPKPAAAAPSVAQPRTVERAPSKLVMPSLY